MNQRQKILYVEKATAGDADALQYLIVHYHATLRGLVAAATDARLRRRIDPDDVLQQAYISAFKNVPGSEFDHPGHFYKWLERVALNQLKDVQRSLRRQVRDVARELPQYSDRTSYPDMIERLDARDPTPSRVIGRDEAVAAMMTCLARLSDDQREVVRLRILEGVPVAEIARRMDKSKVAVYALCRRGLKSLHELMGPMTRYLTQL